MEARGTCPIFGRVICYLSKFVVEKNSLRVISLDNLKGNYDSAIYRELWCPAVWQNTTRSGDLSHQNTCKPPDSFPSYESHPERLPTFLLVDHEGKDKQNVKLLIIDILFFNAFLMYNLVSPYMAENFPVFEPGLFFACDLLKNV